MRKEIREMETKETMFARGAFDIVIGIDPDSERSGLAVLDVRSRKMRVAALPFPELMDALRSAKESAEAEGRSVRVVIEAGYMRKGNWHLRAGDTRASAAAKGRNVGMNHQTGALICEMCRHFGLRVSEASPLPKLWKGRDRKITHSELASFTGVSGRTNQDGRDAALLAWVSAGLPVKV